MILTPKARTRFDAKWILDPQTGCHIWIGRLDRGGYGRFWFEGRTFKAHRIAYEHHVGPIPDGLDIDHLRRTRNCVNPSHMEPVTRTENIRRGMVGENNRRKTHCPQGHPYGGVNLVFDGKGRRCRICRKSARQRWRQRQRERTALVGPKAVLSAVSDSAEGDSHVCPAG